MNRLGRVPPNLGIGLVLIAVALVFEVLGWLLVGQSFLFNIRRLPLILLQVSIVGIIAVGATQVLIMAGVDLSGGSVAAVAAMVAGSFAQASGEDGLYFQHLVDLPAVVPLAVGIAVGCAAGWINGGITAYAGVPPFIPTLGMLVAGRGLAVLYGRGTAITGFTDSYDAIGAGIMPVVIFVGVAIVFDVLLTRTLYGRRTYAIGSNETAARISGINVKSHKVLVYSIAGGLSGLAGVVMSARATMSQPGMAVMYELDAISAAVIGGTSLFGGRGRISGTVIGVAILGLITSGFTFLRINFYYQEIVKGAIIIVAVIADQYRQGQLMPRTR